MVATASLGQFKKREFSISMYSIEKFCGCCKINVVTWSKVVAFQGLMWGPIYVFFGILYFTPKDSIFAEVYLQYSMKNETRDAVNDLFKVDFGLADQAGIIISFFMIFIPLMWMITDILMLHGVWHNKPGFIIPWVVLHIILLVVSISENILTNNQICYNCSYY
jgi:hypothetical protein